MHFVTPHPKIRSPGYRFFSRVNFSPFFEITPDNLARSLQVKTTAPKKYCVKPNSGELEAGGNVDVQGTIFFHQPHHILTVTLFGRP